MIPASIVAGYVALVLWFVAIVSAFAAIWAISDPQTIIKAWDTTIAAAVFAAVLTIIWKELPHLSYHDGGRYY